MTHRKGRRLALKHLMLTVASIALFLTALVACTETNDEAIHTDAPQEPAAAAAATPTPDPTAGEPNVAVRETLATTPQAETAASESGNSVPDSQHQTPVPQPTLTERQQLASLAEPTPTRIPPTPTPDYNWEPSPELLKKEQQEILDHINDIRADRDIHPLELGDNHAAQGHAEHMAESCHNSDLDSWGLKPKERWALAGGNSYSATFMFAPQCYEIPHGVERLPDLVKDAEARFSSLSSDYKHAISEKDLEQFGKEYPEHLFRDLRWTSLDVGLAVPNVNLDGYAIVLILSSDHGDWIKEPKIEGTRLSGSARLKDLTFAGNDPEDVFIRVRRSEIHPPMSTWALYMAGECDRPRYNDAVILYRPLETGEYHEHKDAGQFSDFAAYPNPERTRGCPDPETHLRSVSDPSEHYPWNVDWDSKDPTNIDLNAQPNPMELDLIQKRFHAGWRRSFKLDLVPEPLPTLDTSPEELYAIVADRLEVSPDGKEVHFEADLSVYPGIQNGNDQAVYLVEVWRLRDEQWPFHANVGMHAIWLNAEPPAGNPYSSP